MEAKEKEILGEVISGMKSQFLIPVFQRNYNWKIKNCAKLFEDIICLTESNIKKHFIGSFVYKFNKIVDTQFNQYVLIDGQQRLTSITLILKALYDYLSSFGDSYIDLMKEISEGYLFNVFTKDQKLRLKLKPNKNDDINFNFLMNDEIEEIDKSSSIYINYKFFYDSISEMKCSIESFYNALQRLEGVAVVLNQNDNPQVIFESLNSTGLDLSDVDLIRNYLLMNCNPDEQEKLYTNYWVKMEQLLGDNLISYFRDYLSLSKSLVIASGKTKVYQAFREYSKNIANLNEFLKLLLQNVSVYRKLIFSSDGDDELSICLNDFLVLNMSTTFPFLLGILIDNSKMIISQDETVKIIKLVESYIVRRTVCNVQGGSLSTFMASLYNNLKNKYKDSFYENTYEKVAKEFVSINTNAYFPKNEDFKKEFLERDMYKSQHKFFIISKLEKYLQEKEIINLDNLTIEHIMPRNLSDEWKNYLNIENVEEVHEEYKNKIGNLTLTAYNSEMSDKLFEEKKNHIDFSRLCLNQNLKEIKKWNIDSIKKRGQWMFELAQNIWKYPNVIPNEIVYGEGYYLLSQDLDMDFTNTKPSKIIICNETNYFTSWSEIYIYILKKMYKNNSDLFKVIINTEDFIGNSKSLLFSNEKRKLRAPNEIVENFYCETNLNTMRKIQVLQKLGIGFQYEEEDLIVFIEQE